MRGKWCLRDGAWDSGSLGGLEVNNRGARRGERACNLQINILRGAKPTVLND